ncbi:flavodoxin family protein [Sphaerisporangium dianthi]|uniref:Flavodoxin family protein n=1 Tax=Sphaerisporangium dianthi TaxID=1436120 RepID=A0ABV9CAL6_9ACTN
MYALVVYESMFGNTRQIAKAVAEGLSSIMRVDVVEVGAAPTTVGEDVDLLVVGGPTHAFGMSKPGTRVAAAEQAAEPVISQGIGLREWLDSAKVDAPALTAAAFDTHIRSHLVPGSAARGAEKRLRRLGVRFASPATSFYVMGSPGPLMVGEPDRARQWGERLAATFAAQAS